MGKGIIISGGTDGNYSIKIDTGKATQTARLAKIDARLAELLPLITRAQGFLSVQMVFEGQAEAAVAPTIEAYVTASRTSPIDAAALKTAMDAFSAAMAKLNAQRLKTEPLISALMLLTTEQTQLTKDRATWAALLLEVTQDAWCVDLTEDATGSVATIEIPGESKLVLVAPAAPMPTAADGVLTAREVQSPEQVFWNAAVLPGWQKWAPTYRRGTITAINAAADTADVTLDDDRSSAQKLVINKVTTLADVPVSYMTCNSNAFSVGDKCVVKFTDHDWAQPKVIGFVDHPKSCGGPLSGVVRNPVLVQLAQSKKALNSYKPTAQAWQYQLQSDPASGTDIYHAEPRLARNGMQMVDLAPSLFSGRMTQVVAVLMGRDMPVLYDYHFERCHGVVMGQDGKAWVVEVGRINGVLAMPLPVNTASTDSPEDVVSESLARFGGIPSGGAFPVGAALVSARAAGKVITLATPAALATFYEKTAFSSSCGWSFNDSGSEAHNTCYATDVDGEVTSYHYRINISIGALVLPLTPGTPAAAGTASLTMVESGPLWWWGDAGVARDVPFAFYEPITGRLAQMPGKVIPTSVPGHLAGTPLHTPVMVCHVNGVLDVVRIRSDAQDTISNTECGPPYHIAPTISNGAERYASSTLYPQMRHGNAMGRSIIPAVTLAAGFTTGNPVLLEVLQFQYVGVSIKQQTVERSSVITAAMMRDGYAYFAQGGLYQDEETYVFRYLCKIQEFGYTDGVWGPTYTYERWFFIQNYNTSIGQFPELSAIIAGDADPTGIGDWKAIMFNLCHSLQPFQWGLDGEWGFRRQVANDYYRNTVQIVPHAGPAQLYAYPPINPLAIVAKADYWRDLSGWPGNPLRLACSAFGADPQLVVVSSEGIEVDHPGTMLASEAVPLSDNFTFIGYI